MIKSRGRQEACDEVQWVFILKRLRTTILIQCSKSYPSIIFWNDHQTQQWDIWTKIWALNPLLNFFFLSVSFLHHPPHSRQEKQIISEIESRCTLSSHPGLPPERLCGNTIMSCPNPKSFFMSFVLTGEELFRPRPISARENENQQCSTASSKLQPCEATRKLLKADRHRGRDERRDWGPPDIWLGLKH